MPPRRPHTTSQKKASGFTLIELIVVIAIVAIIIVGIFVALKPADRIEDAETARDESAADQIDSAIQVFIADKGKSPIPAGTTDNPDICEYGVNPTDNSCVSLDVLKDEGYLPEIPEATTPRAKEAGLTGFKLKYAANDYKGVAVTPRASSSSSSSSSLAGGGGASSSSQRSSSSAISLGSSASSMSVSGGGGASSASSFSSMSSAGVSSATSSTVSSSVSSLGPLALNFNQAQNPVVTIPHDTAFNFTNTSQFSISFWIKPGIQSSNWKPLISKFDGAILGYEISLIGGNHIQFFASDNGLANAFVTDGSLLLPQNIYSHVVVSYDGQQANDADRVKIYVNGVSDLALQSSGSPAPFANTSPLKFGQGYAFCFGSCNHVYNGRMDEVKMYARVLDQSDVNALLSESAADPSDDVAYWSFDQNGPNSTTLAGTPQNGTLANFTTATDWMADPFVEPAPVETSQYALKFTQANDTFIGVPPDPALKMSAGDDFSVSFWIKRTPLPGVIMENIADASPHGFLLSIGSTELNWTYTDSPNVATWAVDAASLSSERYSHIVWTYDKDIPDPASRMRVYIDGVSVLVGYGSSGTFPVDTTASGDLEIGGKDAIFLDMFFEGKLDELKYFNRTLTSAEVQNLKTPMFADPASTASWSFDQGGPGSSVLFSLPNTFFGQLNNFNIATDWVTDDAY